MPSVPGNPAGGRIEEVNTMREGRTLRELAKEVDRRRNSKVDFVAKVSALTMAVGRDSLPVVQMEDKKTPRIFGLNDVAHEQLADFVGIPMQYYRRLRDKAPDLLSNEVNRWLLQDHADDTRMVRTLDGKVRALLSDKYRPLENEDLMEAVLPVLKEHDMDILSCDVTDQRLYIKAVNKGIHKDVPTGRRLGDGSHTVFDTVSPAIVVSNSEVGRGSVLVEGGIWTKMCTNMCAFGASMRKFHTGSKAELSDDAYAVLSPETRRLTDAALWAQVRDLVKAALDHGRFEANLAKLTAAAGDHIPKKSDIPTVIELVARKVGLSEGERNGVLACLIEDGDLSRYGIHSAVTRFSQDREMSYDRSSELEKAGGKIIEMPKGEWEGILKQAA